MFRKRYRLSDLVLLHISHRTKIEFEGTKKNETYELEQFAITTRKKLKDVIIGGGGEYVEALNGRKYPAYMGGGHPYIVLNATALLSTLTGDIQKDPYKMVTLEEVFEIERQINKDFEDGNDEIPILDTKTLF